MLEKIKILTDSTSFLSPEDQEEYGITLANLTVQLSGKTVRDMDLDIPRFYAEMKKSEKLPTTSQPPIGDFIASFDRLTKDGSTVIAILISSKMSGTCGTARQAAALLPDRKIHIFDSLNAGQVLANMAIEAAEMVREGKTAAEILLSLADIRNHSDVYIAIGNLNNMLKGGRIHHVAYHFANLLNIKPIIFVKEGRLEIFAKMRTLEKSAKTVVKEAIRLIGNTPIEKYYVVFGHTNYPAGAERLYQELKISFPTLTKTIMEVTPVIGVHLGAGSMGIIISRKRL